MSAAPAATSSGAASPLSLTLSRPADDLHLHCRDGEDILENMLAALLTRDHAPSLDAPVARALLMPNLQPPVTTGALAAAYRTRVLSALERVNARRTAADVAARGAEAAKAAPLKPLQFTPLMSLYLTDATTSQDIQEAKSGTKLGQKPSLFAWRHAHFYSSALFHSFVQSERCGGLQALPTRSYHSFGSSAAMVVEWQLGHGVAASSCLLIGLVRKRCCAHACCFVSMLV